MVCALVLLAGGESATNAHFEFGVELMLLIECADQLFGFRTSSALHDLNVARSYVAFLVHGKGKLSRFMIIGLELHPLEVEHDVGHVLDHARAAWRIHVARR